MADIVLVVELDMKPGQRDAYLARARQHRENVLKNEPGCHRFDLIVPAEDPDKMFLIEVYADQAALDHHLNTPYMKAYLDDTGPMIANRSRTLSHLAND